MLRKLDDLLSHFDPALARVWTLGPGDSCPRCPWRDRCPNRVRCLHLEASCGVSTRTDGPFRRFPLGLGPVGRVFQEHQPLVANHDLEHLEIAEPLWLTLHAIRGFVAVPLLLAGECVGVLALFSRRELLAADVRGLAAIAELLAMTLHSESSDRSPAAAVPLRLLATIEREAIVRTLEATGGRVSGPRGAAGILGLKPTTLHSRMRKLGVRRLSR